MRAAANPEQAAQLMRFFKTGPGEYGFGDRFLGLKVPQTRGYVAACRDYSLDQVLEILRSPFHEERLLALFVLGRRFKQAPSEVLQGYLAHTSYVSNWDLVDSSAPQIVGAALLPSADRGLLDRLAASAQLWERRIAVVATQALIRAGQFDDTLRVCANLLGDTHDLMHKACGWMLREVGNRDQSALVGFLDRHAAAMPRTMLRYSLERLSQPQRAFFMQARQRFRPPPGAAHPYRDCAECKPSRR